MSPRAYRMEGRTTAVEETRAAILAAARRLLEGSGYHRISLDAVAKAAGVARATVYYQFGSKLGLLEAIVADAETRASLPGTPTDEKATGDPLSSFFHRTCEFWAANHVIARNVIGMAAIDPDARTVIESRDAQRRQVLDELVPREAPGRLRLRPTDAVDVLWMLSSFSTFDHLSRGGKRAPKTVARILVRLVAHAVFTDDAE